MNSLIVAWLLTNAAVAEKPTIVVAGVVAPQLEVHVREILFADIMTSVGRSSRFIMVTPEAMGEISKELERQLAGGCAEASCVAQVAELAQAKFVLSVRIMRIGERLQMTLKTVSRDNLAVVGTSQRLFDTIESLQDAIPKQVRLVLKEEEKPATVRVSAIHTNRRLANQTQLYWNDQAIGLSPFEGELPAGTGVLRAERRGKVWKKKQYLKADSRRLVVIEVGTDPHEIKQALTVHGLWTAAAGIGMGIFAFQKASEASLPVYGLTIAADAALVISTGIFLSMAFVR